VNAAMKRMREVNLSNKHRVIRALLAAALLLGFMIFFFIPPAKLPFAACAFHSITGHSCLTCGMTRSLHAIAHGEWAASIRYHLFGPAVLIGMFLCFGIFTAEAVHGKRSAIPIGRKAKVQAFCVFALFWIVYWGARLAGEFG
jgi:hypothetical protein